MHIYTCNSVCLYHINVKTDHFQIFIDNSHIPSWEGLWIAKLKCFPDFLFKKNMFTEQSVKKMTFKKQHLNT